MAQSDESKFVGIESDVAVPALRRYFGPYPGVVRAEIKAPDVFPLETPIDSYVPSSLDDVIDTEELLRQAAGAAESLRQAGQRVVDVFPVFQTAQVIGKRLKVLKKVIDSEFKSAFEHLQEFDLEEATEHARAAGRELGKRGWLVGPFMTPKGLFQVLKKDTDQFMKDRYPVDHLTGMVEESSDSRWQKTILEAIHSCQDGRHRVVILCVLPIIEALVRERVRHRLDTDGLGAINSLNEKATEETEARARDRAFLLAASEASILGFIETRWVNSPDMLENNPSSLNTIDRNWVVHGADDPGRWDPIDAHKLLQVAAVLAYEKKYRSTPEEG
jgi:hypothetical protein